MFKNEVRETNYAMGEGPGDIAVSAGVGAWKTRGRASTAAAPTGSCASVERAGAIVAVLAAADADAISREQRHSCTPSFPRTL